LCATPLQESEGAEQSVDEEEVHLRDELVDVLEQEGMASIAVKNERGVGMSRTRGTPPCGPVRRYVKTAEGPTAVWFSRASAV
jgi:hypothetical protein